MNSTISHDTSSRIHSLPYNPALDGIRGIAVAAVVGTHFNIPFLREGAGGVDVFFVLSGFLITTVLLTLTPRQTLTGFYWNRFTRLAPALVFLCIFYTIFGHKFLDSSQTNLDVFSSISYISNWTRAYGFGTPSYLGNTWSLAVEEQFYLIYPPALMLSSRLAGIRITTAALFLLCLLVPVYRSYLTYSGADFSRTFNGLDTHSDGLALGCALAAIRSFSANKRWAHAVATLDLLSLVGVLTCFSLVPWSSGAILINLASGWLVFGASYPETSIASRVLRAPPLVFLGKLSYSLYLWHYPISLYLFYRLRVSWSTELAIGLPSSLIMAAFSYYAIELPILRWRRGVKSSTKYRLGIACGALAASLMAAGSAYFFAADIAQLISPQSFAIEDYGPRSSPVGVGFNVQPNGSSVIWVKTTTRPPADLAATWRGQRLVLTLSARGIAIFAPQEMIERQNSNIIQLSSSKIKINTILTIEITKN